MTLLRWVGGKAWLADKLRERAPETIDLYIDPFCGGLGAYLAIQDRCSWALLSDANQRLINFWRAVRSTPGNLSDMMNSRAGAYAACQGDEARKKMFYAWKDYMNRGHTNDVSTFWALNKTCFNGLYRENKKGEFNVPWGQRKTLKAPTFAEVEEVALKLQKTTFRDMGALGVLAGSLHQAADHDLVYLDPPYLDTFSSYTSAGFNRSHHEELAKLFHQLPKGSRLASNSIEARHLYPNHEVVRRPCRVKGGLNYVEEILAW